MATADMQPVPARPFFHKVIQIPCFLKCVCMFLQRFPSKHGNLPMPLANSNIYTKNPSKTLFFSVFLHFFRQERRNLHVFRLRVGPKHWFLQCFQCSGIQKPFKISIFTVFFHFCPSFPCRKPTKMTQNSVSMASSAQTHKNRRKNAQTPPIRGLGAKSRSRCEIVFTPPPQLKLI